MAFLVKALFRWNECSKNADISVLSNFLAFFSNFSLYRKIYQILSTRQISDWTIQTEITDGGGGAESALPWPYQSAKSPACLGLILVNDTEYDTNKALSLLYPPGTDIFRYRAVHLSYFQPPLLRT